jgi:predicted ribosome quality control (RQC) complex YloA/Tae2 family protein
MSFDGFFLKNIILEIKSLIINGRIDGVLSTKQGFIFQVHNNKNTHKLFFDLSPEFSSIYLSSKEIVNYHDNKLLNAFLEAIYPLIGGSIILEMYQYKSDRIIEFILSHNDYLLGLIKYRLIFEIFGKRANVILTSNDGKIINLYKRDINNQSRTFIPGATYEYPISTKIELKDHIDYSLFSTSNDISSYYLGVGDQLSKFLFETKKQLFDLKLDACSLQNEYYCLDIFSNSLSTHYPTLSQLLSSKQKSPQKDNNITKFIHNTIAKYNNTITKLQETKEINLNSVYKDYATSLEQYYNDFDNHLEELNNIKLDSRKTLRQNINLFYEKAKKDAKSISKIDENIKKTQDNIESLKDILFNFVEIAHNEDPDIENILNPYGYGKNHQIKRNNKKPQFITKQFQNQVIYIGKNASQNEQLIKNKNRGYYWFHVKGAPGAHLILCSNTINSESLKYMGQLAIQYSSLKDASNVSVDYTTLNNVKKIPNIPTFKVSIKNYKTIVVDPL